MAKKLGKILLTVAAIGAAAAATVHYLHKKDSEWTDLEDEMDDYDDFCEEDEDASGTRTYVPLNPVEAPSDHTEPSCAEQLKEATENLAEQAAEKVEDFFDEDEGMDETDNLS